MPKTILLEKTQEATTTYSVDDSPSGHTYFGGWPLHQKAQPVNPFESRIVVQEGRETYARDWPEKEDPYEAQQVTHFELWIVDQEGREAYICNWPEKKDPYTQADLLINEEEQVQELIFKIRKSIFIPNHESLANRLLILFNDAKEEDSKSPGITEGSLRNFYYFLLLLLHTNLKYPTISLTPDNDIYASWKDEQNRVFSIHFLPNEDTRFVIFKPNDKHPERKIRISGTATTDTLIETVASSGVWDWISG